VAVARHELGVAHELRASAIGKPGARRFWLHVEAEGGEAALWLDKKQLFELAVTAQQLLDVMSNDMIEKHISFATKVQQSFDFRVSRLTLDYDTNRKLFRLSVHDSETHEYEMPTIGVWVSRQRMTAIADEALEVCAAGRPGCPLCGGPIGPGSHTCTRSNGHHPARLG
jgi:uncharacterized repeat protein (TIGR03847 family)